MHCGKVHLTKFHVEVSLPCTGMSVRSPKITSNWRPSSLKTTIVNSIFVQSESKTKNFMSYKSIFMWSTSRLRWNFCTFIFLNPLVGSQPLEGVVRNYFVFFRLELVQHISTGRPEVRIIKSSTKSFGKWCHMLYLQPQIGLQSNNVICSTSYAPCTTSWLPRRCRPLWRTWAPPWTMTMCKKKNLCIKSSKHLEQLVE